MRVVLDANVIVSGIARYAQARSASSRALIAAVDERYMLITSRVIMDEVESAFSKRYFGDRFDERYLDQRLADINRVAVKTELTRQVQGIATHWQDDLVLATTLSGDAEFLVTGDRELLELDNPYPFRIIHPHAFVTYL